MDQSCSYAGLLFEQHSPTIICSLFKSIHRIPEKHVYRRSRKTFQQAQTKSSSKIIRSIVTRNQVLPGLVSVISPSLSSVLSGRCKYISRCVYASGPGRPTSSSLCSPARLLPVTFTSTKVPHGPVPWHRLAVTD